MRNANTGRLRRVSTLWQKSRKSAVILTSAYLFALNFEVLPNVKVVSQIVNRLFNRDVPYVLEKTARGRIK